MKLKKLLLLNSLFFLSFISCSEQKKSKEKTITVVEEKQKKDDKTNIVTNIASINKDTVNQNKIKISTTKKHPITDSLMVKKIKNAKAKAEDETKPYPDPNDNGPKAGTFYIKSPKQRIKDSINIFVSMYDRLIANLENKGITNQKEKDSIIWEHWQKQIMENDYRHKHISFSEYWKNKE